MRHLATLPFRDNRLPASECSPPPDPGWQAYAPLLRAVGQNDTNKPRPDLRLNREETPALPPPALIFLLLLVFNDAWRSDWHFFNLWRKRAVRWPYRRRLSAQRLRLNQAPRCVFVKTESLSCTKMNTHLRILNTLNIDAEVTLRSLNMLIEKIDCVFTGASDKIIDCRQLERWIFAGAAVRFKESSTFLHLCQCTTLSRLSLPFHLSPSTTNQVYQSLMSKPWDGTLV